MPEQIHTLVVDDEKTVRSFLCDLLEEENHQVVTAADGEEALSYLRDVLFDLVILDLRLDGPVSGVRVLDAVKWRWPKTAIVILTGDTSLNLAVSAVRKGTDDYLLKPAEPTDVLRAVELALERESERCCVEEERHVFRWQALTLDERKRQVELDSQSVDLTQSEFELLRSLMQNVHRVVSPQDLFRAMHNDEGEDKDEQTIRRDVRWHIHQLRQKLEPDPTRPQYVVNVYGKGYRLGN